MAGTLKTSQFNSATVANPTDEVPLLQGGQLKRVQVKVLTGNPDIGWVASGESWVFSSFSSTTRIGVVTVPSDATTKYSLGNRVRVSQATGGVKYGIIHYITSTALHIFFPAGTTLNNEAITSSFYTSIDTPIGFIKNPDIWSLESSLTTDGVLTGIATNSWYNINSHSVAYGVGAWKIYGKVSCGMDRAAAGRTDVVAGLSTSKSSPSNQKWIHGQATGSGGVFSAAPFTISDDFITTTAGTLYWITSPSAASPSTLYNFGAVLIGGARVIRLTSAYL